MHKKKSIKKYKVGDRVVVRDDICTNDGTSYRMYDNPCSTNTFVYEMGKFCGQVVTIATVSDQYTIEECSYRWTDEMFLGLESEVFRKAPSIDDLL